MNASKGPSGNLTLVVLLLTGVALFVCASFCNTRYTSVAKRLLEQTFTWAKKGKDGCAAPDTALRIALTKYRRQTLAGKCL